jgi:hypothetical protein
MGTAFGGLGTLETQINEFSKGGPSKVGWMVLSKRYLTSHRDISSFRPLSPRQVSPLAVPMLLGNSIAGNIAIELGALGPNFGTRARRLYWHRDEWIGPLLTLAAKADAVLKRLCDDVGSLPLGSRARRERPHGRGWFYRFLPDDAPGAWVGCAAVLSACAAATHALGVAYNAIATGEADIMISGGAEAAITPFGFAGQWGPDPTGLAYTPGSGKSKASLVHDMRGGGRGGAFVGGCHSTFSLADHFRTVDFKQ